METAFLRTSGTILSHIPSRLFRKSDSEANSPSRSNPIEANPFTIIFLPSHESGTANSRTNGTASSGCFVAAGNAANRPTNSAVVRTRQCPHRVRRVLSSKALTPSVRRLVFREYLEHTKSRDKH